MNILINKEKILKHFTYFKNWEDKYLYIIELGEQLPSAPKNIRQSKYLIIGCQSRVWIMIRKKINSNFVKIYGDSDTLIIKGLLAIIFSIYQDLELKDIINYKIFKLFNTLSLTKHLTPSRSQGLVSIIRTIQTQIKFLLRKN
ncbi:MAG: sulfur acceptor for SufS cysteine desulfurase [Candidatus Westeberhardia cardiocondylae]|nr:sulfur acceptor for SufS cysteine desulfurase [Candidatus Westeberhardia cardiocondylae]